MDSKDCVFDIEGFFRAVISQDADSLMKFFCDDAKILWHCTNECFTVGEYIKANCEYPGAWNGKLERVVFSGNTVIAAFHVYSSDGDISCHAVSFLQISGGLISGMDEYWGDDGEPPEWRKAMNIGVPIVK